MIVEMKKLYLLSVLEERELTLSRLAELGVMHITATPADETEEISLAKLALHNAETALSAFSNVKKGKKETGSLLLHSARAESGAEIVEKILQINQRIRECHERFAECDGERADIEPFGHFKPEDFSKLTAQGLTLQLLSVPAKSNIELPENVSVFDLAPSGGNRYLLAASKDDIEIPGAQVHPLPQRSLGAVLLEIESCKAELDAADAEIAALARETAVVERYIKELQEQLMFSEARASLESNEAVIYLSGFCPAESEESMRNAAREYGWGVIIQDVTEEDEVPTLIKYPAWAKPIKNVFDIIDLRPGYNEVDISSIFYIAFALFFAMLIGDAGYGAIFLLTTIALLLKFRDAPAAPFILGGVLSTGTIIWGVITANYFGFSPAATQGLQIKWLADGLVTNELNMSILCFLIGAVHLTIAHLWRIVLMINSTKALAQAGWISLTWAMYFAARWLVLGLPLSPLLMPLFITGLVLIVLFMVPVKKLKTEGIAFVTFPFDVISNFVDVVSYIRLFAVGSASLAVAMAFNEIALSLGIVGTILIMLAGHSLNIVLCIMGVLVHGIRLNTLEFSGHMDLTWSGFKYSPFAKRTGSNSLNDVKTQ